MKPRGSWVRILAIARRHVYALRSAHRLFDISIWPLVDAVLFGSIGVFIIQQGGQEEIALGYLLAGIVLWHVIYQAQISVSTGFMEETWTRNLLNLMVTPLTELEYAIGVALFGLVKLVIGVGLVALSAFVFYAFDFFELGLGLIPIVAILILVGWVIALFVIGLQLRFGSGAEALAWGLLFTLMPLSGTFYPVEALPGALQPIALVLPTTHAFAAARGLVDGRGLLWGELAIGAAMSVVAAAAGVAYITWMLRVFRKRGYISRYS